MESLLEVRQQFPESNGSGLSSEQVEQSRRQFGGNRLTPLSREPIWKKFLEKFDEPIIKILLAAALLSILVDLFKPPVQSARFLAGGLSVGASLVFLCWAYFTDRANWMPSILFLTALVIWPIGLATGHASADGLAVMIAVVLATGVAFLSEFRSDREFEVLNARKDVVRIKVQRGTVQTIALEEVVVGDRVILDLGDEVPADGRVVAATELYLDQSLMTGESEPVAKQVGTPEEPADGPERADCVYRGTQVVQGAGHMVVCQVGDATALGQIARSLSQEAADDTQARVKSKLTISKELTPLQLKLQNLAQLISRVGYVAAVAIFVALVIQGIVKGELRWPGPEDDTAAVVLDSASKLLDYFLYMVIVIVVAVPEGLPMSVTVSLALAMRKMTRANSLVRQLVACETIGSATVICSDKTGTLTQNKMQVVRLGWDAQVFDRESPSWPTQGPVLEWIILNAGVNSTAYLEEKEGKLMPVGNSTEGALLLWLKDNRRDYHDLRKQHEVIHQILFSSERKRMTTAIRHEGKLMALVKGAPEWLLAHSRQYLAADGSVRDWSPDARAAIEGLLAEAARQAMRTLAFGHAFLPDVDLQNREELERNLIFVGFAAIRDPLRSDVRDALAACQRAGIQVKMITGDSVETARGIGTEIGLLYAEDALVMTHQEFKALDDETLKQKLPNLRVLARAQPLDKYRMVRLLQELGEVVAVTGDGTNDAPALKKADVGLAMGISGTEVAKEASRIVLLDDSFATIVRAVHWGRSLYENIQRFIQFQLTINVSALVIAFLGPFLGVKPPFTVLQLLWINVIMDTLASVALCSEPPHWSVMKVPPKRRDENILTRSMILTILGTAGFFVVVMIALLAGMEYGRWFAGPGGPSEEFPELTARQVSIFFTVYVLFQVWNEINCRSLEPRHSGLRGLHHNPMFLGIVLVILLGQWLIVTFGGSIFKVEPLGWLDWLLIIAGTSTVVGFAGFMRRVRLALRLQ